MTKRSDQNLPRAVVTALVGGATFLMASANAHASEGSRLRQAGHPAPGDAPATRPTARKKKRRQATHPRPIWPLTPTSFRATHPMQKPLFAMLKALILVTYALALAALLGGWTSPWSAGVQTAAGLLLLVHAVELVFVLKHVRCYPGPLALSVLLTLIYALLHWKPLADKIARTVSGRAL